MTLRVQCEPVRSTWVAVLAAPLIALGVVGLWAQRTLGDVETFAALAGDILEQPEVRTELAVVIVDPALEGADPELRAQRAFIVTTTASVLGSPRFVPAFEDVLRRAHRRLVEGEGAVRLELEPSLDLVVAEVERLSPEVAAELARVDPPEPEVVSAEQADRLRGFLAFERTVSVALLVVGVVAVVAAVLVGGGRVLLPFGATLAGVCLLVFGMLLLGRELLLGEIAPASRADAAKAAWNVVISDLRTALFLSAGAGAAAVVAGGALSRGRRGPAARA